MLIKRITGKNLQIKIFASTVTQMLVKFASDFNKNKKGFEATLSGK